MSPFISSEVWWHRLHTPMTLSSTGISSRCSPRGRGYSGSGACDVTTQSSGKNPWAWSRSVAVPCSGESCWLSSLGVTCCD